MSSLMLTIILAVAFFFLACLGLGIGWIITGRHRFKMCGSRPQKNPSGSCSGNKIDCPVCQDNRDRS